MSSSFDERFFDRFGAPYRGSHLRRYKIAPQVTESLPHLGPARQRSLEQIESRGHLNGHGCVASNPCGPATFCHLDGRRASRYVVRMPEPQLSVRSAKARDLAHRLARRENRSIADIVERALQVYEARETGREPAASFYAGMAAGADDEDIDLDALIRAHRQKNIGPDF